MVGGGRRDLAHRLVSCALQRRRCRRNAACIDDIQLPEVLDAVERRLAMPRGA